MIFYHRTTEERWDAIQKEGFLWGIHGHDWVVNNSIKKDTSLSRYTYLAPDDPGDSYGSVLLEIEYKPERDNFGKKHNYGFDPPEGQICWQFSVFEPIPLSQVKRVN